MYKKRIFSKPHASHLFQKLLEASLISWKLQPPAIHIEQEDTGTVL